MNKKLIFIAEDEAAYRRILQDRLEKEGYAVIVAGNGEDLLKNPRIQQASLILLDLVMAVKNGFQVIAEMKKDKKLRSIHILALSNLGQEDDIAKAQKLGADDYIVKSDVTISSVIDKVKTLLK